MPGEIPPVQLFPVQVGKIGHEPGFLAEPSSRPGLGWADGDDGAARVVLGAAGGIAERFVGLAQQPERADRATGIRVHGLGQPPVRGFQLGGRCRPAHAEHLVVVDLQHAENLMRSRIPPSHRLLGAPG